jgi:hypothetical protein
VLRELSGRLARAADPPSADPAPGGRLLNASRMERGSAGSL